MLYKGAVLSPGSLHLTLMATFGVWLWSLLDSFGSADPQRCRPEQSSIVILNNNIPLTSNALRACSTILYSLFLLPGLNLILPMVVFLGIFIGYHTLRNRWYPNHRRPGASGSGSDTTAGSSMNFLARNIFLATTAFRTWYNRLPAFLSIIPILLGLLFLFVINIVLLVDTERTLGHNQDV